MLEEEHLSSEYFQKFKDLIYDEIGINLLPHKQTMLEGRIKKRLRKLKIDKFESYYELILTNNDEKIELFNVVSTNKTEFFREKHHFDVLQKYIPDLIRNNKKAMKQKFSVWSVAASTGEEAYTILMYLLENFPILAQWKLKVIASDISTNVLKVAQAGIYQKYKIENVESKYLEKYFQEYDDKTCRISEKLKHFVKFKKINLKDKDYPFKGEFEIIFCRNILIYFDGATKWKILKNVLRYLKPKGLLIVGSMEPIPYSLEEELKIKKLESTVYIKL